MDGWMDGWMDGFIVQSFLLFSLYTIISILGLPIRVREFGIKTFLYCIV